MLACIFSQYSFASNYFDYSSYGDPYTSEAHIKLVLTNPASEQSKGCYFSLACGIILILLPNIQTAPSFSILGAITSIPVHPRHS